MSPGKKMTKRPFPASASSASTSESRKRAKKFRNDPGISIDQLQWKEVSMPDRLDDVEGFMGLEEIDGVEVLDVGEGKVEYKLSGKSKRPTKNKKGMPVKGQQKRESNRNDKKKQQEGEEEEEEDEWKGFTTDDENQVPGKTKEKSVRKQKKEKKTGSIKPVGNPFASLQNADTDGGELEDVDLPAWDALNLSTPTLRALSKLSFGTPTPIQESAIPDIIAGHDLIGKASTGSGKTLAFGIPILEYYLSQEKERAQFDNDELPGEDKPKKIENEKCPLALILCPTRELAHQLHSHITALAVFVPDFQIVTLTGGLSLQKQLRQLEGRSGADVVIATPGRLWEVVSEGQGWIKKLREGLKFLVVDEADRLLQEGHFKEVEEVMALLEKPSDEEDSGGESESSEDEDEKVPNEIAKPKKIANVKMERQTLVFSATFHKGLQQKLAGKSSSMKSSSKGTAGGGDLMGQEESMEYLLKKLKFREATPKFVDVNPIGQLAARLKEGIIECGAMEKDLYLYYLLLRYPCRTLVFTNSIFSVKRLAPFISELQLAAHPLHSGMIQKARLRSLERFSSPTSPNSILIATDVAARGLDIKDVEMIIHYHLPRTADMYVHRSGRAARGTEARGISILLCAPEEVAGVRRLVGKVHEGSTALSTGRYLMKSFDVDRMLVTRLKRRVDLAKKIADSSMEKQKKGHEDEWLKKAAEELGVDYDSDEFSKTNAGRKGGDRGRKKKDEAANATKGEVAGWRAELREQLGQKVNSGFSQKYLTSGNVNLAQALLEGGTIMHEGFLGLERKSAFDEVGEFN